jgi:hypothetical protein
MSQWENICKDFLNGCELQLRSVSSYLSMILFAFMPD